MLQQCLWIFGLVIYKNAVVFLNQVYFSWMRYAQWRKSTGWHKNTVITKNRITSKIAFRLTQNSSYIRSSLCSRHLQSFKSLLKNSLFHWRSKNVLHMSSPALQAHLDPTGKVLDDPPTFLPWDRSYCYCDCCLQVRDSLRVVAIHTVQKVSPQIKSGGLSPVNAATTAGHTCGW